MWLNKWSIIYATSFKNNLIDQFLTSLAIAASFSTIMAFSPSAFYVGGLNPSFSYIWSASTAYILSDYLAPTVAPKSASAAAAGTTGSTISSCCCYCCSPSFGSSYYWMSYSPPSKICPSSICSWFSYCIFSCCI